MICLDTEGDVSRVKLFRYTKETAAIVAQTRRAA